MPVVCVWRMGVHMNSGLVEMFVGVPFAKIDRNWLAVLMMAIVVSMTVSMDDSLMAMLMIVVLG